MGVERRHSHVKFSKTIRLGKNLDLDNAVAGEVEVGSLRDNGTNIQRWDGTFWDNIGNPLFVKLITSADSPYTVVNSDDIIEATIDATDIDILLLPLADVKRELRIIRNETGAGTAVLDVITNGSEKIKEPGGVLIGNKEMNGDGDSLNLLGINSAHYNII